MRLSFLKKGFEENRNELALADAQRMTTYSQLMMLVEYWLRYLQQHQIANGSVVAFEGDFEPRAVAFLLALIENDCIAVPLTSISTEIQTQLFKVSCAQHFINIGKIGNEPLNQLTGSSHPLIDGLRDQNCPGLIVFSSGSAGEPKAILHNFQALLEKFKTKRKKANLLSFLHFDHMGGLNTLLYSLSNGGCLVNVEDRQPETICRAIEQHRVQILPCSPTFLNLLLLSECYKRYDLSSLEWITYGTEPMPASCLERLRRCFPKIQFQQTYGLSEVGVLRSKSESNESLWVKIGGEGFETRVVNEDMLEIKAKTAMLGYLNAPSPFTPDGWLKTGDVVRTKGEFLQILGRKSDLISVGGEKVFPAEIESVIQLMPGVREVCVYGEPNAITGQMIVSELCLDAPESADSVKRRLHLFCRQRLKRFQIPQKVLVSNDIPCWPRLKKRRPSLSDQEASYGRV